MDYLQTIKLSEISDREKQMLYDKNDMWSLKTSSEYSKKKKKSRVTNIENKSVVTSGEGGRETM